MVYTYETTFKLLNPVNDIDAARKYLTSDDMTKYLKDDLFGGSDSMPHAESIISIEWNLVLDNGGYIELKTNEELTPTQLDYISEWVLGQNSDGLGEGFEQQDFAITCDENEWGEPDWDTCEMASFDWETNKYKFKLKNKTNESVLHESLQKCCETCKYYVYDYSTGTSECNCSKEGEWVKVDEPDIWTVDVDYCTEYVAMPYEESVVKEDKEKPENSVLVCHFVFEDRFSSNDFKALKSWLENYDISGWADDLVERTRSVIKKAEITQIDNAGFAFKVYTNIDLIKFGVNITENIVAGVVAFVLDELEPDFQEQPFGHYTEVVNRCIYPRPYLNKIQNEAKKLKESNDLPTEYNPMVIDAPRGEYYVWVAGGEIIGSGQKPDPSKRIVNARNYINFTSQGFKDIEEVVDYIKKYF